LIIYNESNGTVLMFGKRRWLPELFKADGSDDWCR